MRVPIQKKEKIRLQLKMHPLFFDYLDDEVAHFDEVRAMLDSLNIPHMIDTNMVRGSIIQPYDF